MEELKQKSISQDTLNENPFKGKFDKEIIPSGTTEWKHDPSKK